MLRWVCCISVVFLISCSMAPKGSSPDSARTPTAKTPTSPLEEPRPTTVQGTVRPRLNAVMGCYRAELATNPKLGGQAIITFEINDQGQAGRVRFDKRRSTFRHKGLEGCISALFQSWPFPMAPKGKKFEVEYPLTFSYEPSESKKASTTSQPKGS